MQERQKSGLVFFSEKVAGEWVSDLFEIKMEGGCINGHEIFVVLIHYVVIQLYLNSICLNL